MESFGVGNHIKLPGPSPSQPNSYAFGSVTYKEIYDDLKQKDEKLYTHNGLLSMMQKDMKVKEKPQRWQDRTADDGVFDVVVTFEKRVMDMVVQNLQQGENGMEPCMVINIVRWTTGLYLLCRMREQAYTVDEWFMDGFLHQCRMSPILPKRQLLRHLMRFICVN